MFASLRQTTPRKRVTASMGGLYPPTVSTPTVGRAHLIKVAKGGVCAFLGGKEWGEVVSNDIGAHIRSAHMVEEALGEPTGVSQLLGLLRIRQVLVPVNRNTRTA